MVDFLDKFSLVLNTKGLEEKKLLDFFNQEGYDEYDGIEALKLYGISLHKKDKFFYFKTLFTKLKEETFCIVDIETSASKVKYGQIIEIGAVKVKDSKIIDSFESLVHCLDLNSHIEKITGINKEMLINAPSLKEVLFNFKLFLKDSIFVAHDLSFDFNFINSSLENIGLPPLLNKKLCTIKLAKKLIKSDRYGLRYLNEQFDLYENANYHRALSDAKTSFYLFKKCLNNLNEIRTSEDLINFANAS